MYCVVLQRDVDMAECAQCWGDDAPGIGSEMHMQCQRSNLQERDRKSPQIDVCWYPNIQLDRLCDGCPVGKACSLSIKGMNLLHGTKVRKRGALSSEHAKR